MGIKLKKDPPAEDSLTLKSVRA